MLRLNYVRRTKIDTKVIKKRMIETYYMALYIKITHIFCSRFISIK